MTKNVQLGILLSVVGFMMGAASGYWYWLTNCTEVTATATRQLENVITVLNQRMDSSRGPIFPIPLAKSDSKEMRDVIQKFTTDLNGNLYMLVPIPTSAQIREVTSIEETQERGKEKEDPTQTPTEAKKK